MCNHNLTFIFLDFHEKFSLVLLQMIYYMLSPWLAQLGEHRSAEREVVGSNPGWTNTQGL